jgi:hypothetical protein
MRVPLGLAPTPATSIFDQPQVRLLWSLGPCSHACGDVLAAIRTLAALTSGHSSLLTAGARTAVQAAAAAAAAAGGAHRIEARRAGVIQGHARAALQALTSPPGALPRAPLVVVVNKPAAAPPKCSACGAAAPPGGGPLQKCTGCGGAERGRSKENQRAR